MNVVIPFHQSEFLVICWDSSGEIVINTTYNAISAVDALAQYQADQIREYEGTHRLRLTDTRLRIARIEIKRAPR